MLNVVRINKVNTSYFLFLICERPVCMYVSVYVNILTKTAASFAMAESRRKKLVLLIHDDDILKI